MKRATKKRQAKARRRISVSDLNVAWRLLKSGWTKRSYRTVQKNAEIRALTPNEARAFYYMSYTPPVPIKSIFDRKYALVLQGLIDRDVQ